MRGFNIVEEVGPPDRKPKKYSKAEPDDEDMLDGGADEAEEGDDDGDREAAEISAMEEFQDAVKNGTPEEALKAYKQLSDVCG